MDRPVKMEWLMPFAQTPEQTALDDESAFQPHLPRRITLNRLNRLREAGWVERPGEARSTI